ncbi:MAG: AMP-binding protein [Candidatus Sedimenticola sp. 1PA]
MIEPEQPGTEQENAVVTAKELLTLIRNLACELHPNRQYRDINLDNSIDRDLGFDSLGRVELLVRIEKRFECSLLEKAFIEAETPRDLLGLILTAAPATTILELSPLPGLDTHGADPEPIRATTLNEMLEWHAEVHGDRPHVILYGDEEEPETLTYMDLFTGAKTIAAGLQGRGVAPGQTVSIMLPTSREYLYSFFGILLCGAVPVPIYPPARLSQVEDHLRRHARILDNAQSVLMITVAEAKTLARLLQSQVGTLKDIVTPDDLGKTAVGVLAAPRVTPDDIAFLQYTSGSTGNPKGVTLTHANLMANIRAMGQATGACADDVFVSWLPLYHDMGLIGAWLGSLYFAAPLVLMSPLRFLVRPVRWLQAIHRHRGTLAASPNFGFELCLNKIDDTQLQGLDLSSWRMAFNGAEPVSANTIQRFNKRFARYGFRPEAMSPVYGLAESSVGLAFPPLDRGPLIDRIEKDTLASTGSAVPAVEQEDASEIVACGQVLQGHRIRIVDHNGNELPDRREGHLQFRGPSTTQGYFRNPVQTEQLFKDGWLDSGDLAYTVEDDIYITSRVKDLIIRGGRNIYPYEVEEEIGNTPGVRKGCVAVFGSEDRRTGTERIIVLVETRETRESQLAQLKERLFTRATDLLDMPPDEVVLAPPHTVLKTSSGKIRRSACRELYDNGMATGGRRAVWQQFGRLAWSGLPALLIRGWQSTTRTLYAAYVWGLLFTLAPPVWLLTALLPGIRRRWKLNRQAASLYRRMLGISLEVEGLENLPEDGPCVLVANHASYIDGMVIVSALPRRFRFVAKAELLEQFVPRIFLQRIGSEFVERFDRQASADDAKRLSGLAETSDPLLFFPEGTFQRPRGLLSFRLGAFVAAAQSGLTVVPITIQGSREILPANTWFPRHGHLKVTVNPPIMPGGSDWQAAVKLRDEARQAILSTSGEGDLQRG